MTETDTSRERLERLQSMGCADYLHMALLARVEKVEAERDTAWNDAIEAAAKRNSLTVRSIKEALDMRDWDAAREIAMKGPPAIRALRKGEPT